MDNAPSYMEASHPIVRIVSTVPDHIGDLKSNLRQEDTDEILRFGISIQKALWRSYKYSLIRKTALIDCRVAACWGLYGTFMGRTGVPWLLTSPHVNSVSPLKFARVYQEEVLGMLRVFPRLENYVDAEHKSAIRLLDIIGFTIDKGRVLSVNGNAYRKFWIEA